MMKIIIVVCLACINLSTLGGTRITYQGNDGLVVTGKNTEFPYDIPPQVWKFPRGLERHGEGGERSLEWVSNYGSVVVFFSCAAVVAEGMNEAGLTAHLLWLNGTDYGSSEVKPTLSLTKWVQFVLDNYASVNEAIDDLEQKDIQLVSPNACPDNPQRLFLSITDSLGVTAVIEYHEGKQKIYASQGDGVSTSLSHDETEALDAEFRQKRYKLDTLPGSYLSAARYQRATYFLEKMEKTSEADKALSGVRSVLETVTVPRYLVDNEQPHFSQTLYRTLMDQKNRFFHYQNLQYLFDFWVCFDDLNFEKETEVLFE